MLILLVLSIIIGAIVAGVTGIGVLFWVISIFFFICGLPAALITGFVHGENGYAQDRADYREELRELVEEERFLERELHEDERLGTYLDAMEDHDDEPDIYIDNRQIHFHDHQNSKSRLKKSDKL
jgi:hypothetical protein